MNINDEEKYELNEVSKNWFLKIYIYYFDVFLIFKIFLKWSGSLVYFWMEVVICK